MAKSKIITDHANNIVPLEVVLKRIMVLTSNFEDKSINVWAENEISGYSKDAIIPKYRIIRGTIMGSYQIVGYGLIQTHSRATLPTIGLKKEEIIEFCTTSFIQGISVLRELAVNESCCRPLPMECYQIFETGTNINVTDAYVSFSKNQILSILSKVDSIALSILLDLEKYFGNLDSLDIEQKPAREQSSIEKELIQFIFEDNSINIGDGNRIKNSDVLSSIKDIMKGR